MSSNIVLDLGTRKYEEVWELQKMLVGLRASGRIPDTLMLVEHEHVITLGRRTTPENFRPQNIPVFQVERGGDATYHGPGQLVGYPIMKLVDNDVHRYLRQLEETLIRSVAEFGIRGERKEGHTGVWVGSGNSNNKKIASIGVAISSWVTYHGFALNVSTDMSYFHLIKPCGLNPETLSSMKQLLGRDISMEDVKRAYLDGFSAVFGVGLENRELAELAKLEVAAKQKIK